MDVKLSSVRLKGSCDLRLYGQPEHSIVITCPLQKVICAVLFLTD